MQSRAQARRQLKQVLCGAIVIVGAVAATVGIVAATGHVARTEGAMWLVSVLTATGATSAIVAAYFGLEA